MDSELTKWPVAGIVVCIGRWEEKTWKRECGLGKV